MRAPTVALLFCLPGCACGGEWYIRQNQSASGEPPACTVSDDPDAPFRTVGRMDLALTNQYFLNPLVENETSDGIQIDGAEVLGWCNEARGEPALGSFFSPAPAFVDEDDRVGTSLIAIHAGMADALRNGTCCPGGSICGDQIVILGVRMMDVAESTETETPQFEYPVEVCTGCLVSCAVDADSADVAGADCCANTAPPFTPCFPGQDDPVDCRTCRGVPFCQCGNSCN